MDMDWKDVVGLIAIAALLVFLCALAIVSGNNNAARNNRLYQECKSKTSDVEFCVKLTNPSL